MRSALFDRHLQQENVIWRFLIADGNSMQGEHFARHCDAVSQYVKNRNARIFQTLLEERLSRRKKDPQDPLAQDLQTPRPDAVVSVQFHAMTYWEETEDRLHCYIELLQAIPASNRVEIIFLNRTGSNAVLKEKNQPWQAPKAHATIEAFFNDNISELHNRNPHDNTKEPKSTISAQHTIAYLDSSKRHPLTQDNTTILHLFFTNADTLNPAILQKINRSRPTPTVEPWIFIPCTVHTRLEALIYYIETVPTGMCMASGEYDWHARQKDHPTIMPDVSRPRENSPTRKQVSLFKPTTSPSSEPKATTSPLALQK